MGPALIQRFPVPIALQGRSRPHRGSAGAQSEQLGRSTPDLRSDDRDSDIRTWEEPGDRGPGVQQPPEITPESGGGQDGEDAHDPVQSGESGGKSLCSSCVVIHIDRCYQ